MSEAHTRTTRTRLPHLALAALASTSLAAAQTRDPVPPAHDLGALPILRAWPQAGYDYAWGSSSFRVLGLDGGTLNSWSVPVAGWKFGELVKPLGFGHVLAHIHDPMTTGVNTRKRLVEMDWQGNLVWQYVPPIGRKPHHDFERLPNGNTTMFAEQVSSLPGMPQALIDDYIMEVDPTGALVWEWSSLAHMSQMPISSAGWQFLFGYHTPPIRLFHANSLQSLPPNKWEATDSRFASGNLLVSYRELNLVMIIEKQTGNIVWSMVDQTIAQHHPRMIPRDLPGAGNILVYDNGGFGGAPRLWRNTSQVLEINPVTMAVVWSFACTGASPCPGQFFSRSRGSAQRLANGNTLICNPDLGTEFEVTRKGIKVWQRSMTSWLYRAYRWPLAWPNGPINFIW